MLGINWIENYLSAGNPETPQEQLTKLAISDHHKIRMRVAENPRAPREILEYLAKDKHADVRLAVATNRSSPPEIILKLAHDDDATVRLGLAEDPETSREVLRILCNDENPYVSCQARKTMQSLGLVSSEDSDVHRLYLWPTPQRQRFA